MMDETLNLMAMDFTTTSMLPSVARRSSRSLAATNSLYSKTGYDWK
jgi:hypothetical protein